MNCGDGELHLYWLVSNQQSYRVGKVSTCQHYATRIDADLAAYEACSRGVGIHNACELQPATYQNGSRGFASMRPAHEGFEPSAYRAVSSAGSMYEATSSGVSAKLSSPS